MQEGKYIGKFYYYDLKKNEIFLGSPKTLNVEKDHYSAVVEDSLSARIEAPLGRVIKSIKDSLETGCVFKLNQEKIDVIFDYLYSLKARSPEMSDEIYEKIILKNYFSEQNIHDISAIGSLELMQKHQVLKEFYPSFVVNRTATPFVLPMCGYYDFKTSDEDGVVQIPLTEKICVRLFKTKYRDKYIKNGNLSLRAVDNTDVLYKMNELAFITQKRYKNAYLVSSNKEELERIKKVKQNEEQ
ncbi:MAG: DUF4238 domain-containing protein [Clostridia bacterium]|nr:DUF4238 domain-containing protein [Clostridia bacterium]